MFPDDVEPTADDLADIEAEWLLIEAELAITEAQIQALLGGPGPCELDWQRLRRARRRVLRDAAARYAVRRAA